MIMVGQFVDLAVLVVEIVLPRRGVAENVGFGEQLAGEGGEIARRRKIRLLAPARRQAVRRIENGVGQAEIAGADVHEFDERLLRARDLDGQGDRGVVGRVHHQRVEQFLDGDLLLVHKPHLRAAGSCRLGGDGDGGVERQVAVLDFLRDDEKGHQLGDARRRILHVGVVLEEHAPGRGVEHDGAAIGVVIDLGRRGLGIFPRRGRHRGNKARDGTGGNHQQETERWRKHAPKEREISPPGESKTPADPFAEGDAGAEADAYGRWATRRSLGPGSATRRTCAKPASRSHWVYSSSL